MLLEHVLILSGNQKTADSIAGFVRESFRCTPKIFPSAYQAKMALENDNKTEIVLINAPLIDESGIELAKFITKETSASCILLLKQEQAEQLKDMVDRYQIFVLGRPINKTILYQLLRTIEIAMQRARTIYEENQRLEQKIKDIRTVDRAKFLLMQYRSMTEAEAHSYLEKYAMNKRKRKTIAALEIIDQINEQYL